MSESEGHFCKDIAVCIVKTHLLDKYHWCNGPLNHLLCARLGVMRGGSNRNCSQGPLQPFLSSCEGFSGLVSGVLRWYLQCDLDSLLWVGSEAHESFSTESHWWWNICSLLLSVCYSDSCTRGWVFSHLSRVALQWLFLGESSLVCVTACPRCVCFPSLFLGSSLQCFLREGRYKIGCSPEHDRTPCDLHSAQRMANRYFLGDTGHHL